jgi:hypothetical protein
MGISLSLATLADAGIVTSMDAVVCSPEAGASQTWRADPSSFGRQFEQLVKTSPSLDHALPSSTSTTGGATGPGIGQTQLLVAFETVFDIQDLPARGWTAPESTLALPPLLPSGLFRPPRND